MDEVVGELVQHRVEGDPRPVLRVVADVGDPTDELEVDAAGDRLVEPRGRPPCNLKPPT